MHDLNRLISPDSRWTLTEARAINDRGQIVGMSLRLGPHVRTVDVAVCVAIHHHDVHAGHVSGGRIRPVSRRWDKTYVAMSMPPPAVIGANGEQTRIFTLRAGIGLH